MALIHDSVKGQVTAAGSVDASGITGAAGYKLIAIVTADIAGALAGHASWGAALYNSNGPGAAGGGQLAIFEQVLAGAPDATYTFTTGAGSGNMEAVIVSVNPDGGTFGTTVINVGDNPAATAVTPAVAGAPNPSVLLGVWYIDGTATVVTPPATMDPLLEFVDESSSDLAVGGELDAGEGSLTRTLVWSAGSSKMQTLILIPLTVASGPAPTSATPDTGDVAGGQAVTIAGTGFDASGGASEGVTFGGTAATSVVFVGPTEITCVTPAHAAGAVDVVVTNGDAATGTLVNGYTYTVGPVLDPNPMTATDASGDATSDLTSDLPLDGTPGQYLELTTTIDGVTLRCATLPETP